MDETMIASADDPLSAALTRMKLSTLIHVTLQGGGAWAVDFPGHAGFTLSVVQRGNCWLLMEGRSPLALGAGDSFLLTGATPYCLASEPAAPLRTPVSALFALAPDGKLQCGDVGQPGALLAGTLFKFEGLLPPLILAGLPPVIHVPAALPQAAVLRWSLQQFIDELGGSGAGRVLMLNHLAPLMLLQTLRVYLASRPNDNNYLVALADVRLARVLDAIHSDSRRNWSVAALAQVAGMSRAAFALAFKNAIGVAPFDYLASWRMQLACELLEEGTLSMAAIAARVGYGSESAFSLAFKRIVQCRPGVYRRRLDSVAAANVSRAS